MFAHVECASRVQVAKMLLEPASVCFGGWEGGAGGSGGGGGALGGHEQVIGGGFDLLTLVMWSWGPVVLVGRSAGLEGGSLVGPRAWPFPEGGVGVLVGGPRRGGSVWRASWRCMVGVLICRSADLEGG